MSTKKTTTLEQLRLLAARTQAELAKRDERIEGLVTAGGEPNVLNGVKVNGTALTIANKMVDILIASGSANGTLAVNGVDIAVKGLAALAYKAEVSEAELSAALKSSINDKVSTGVFSTVQSAVNTLTGTGDGSVKKTVDDAINAFATSVSDDNVVNKFKELVDWVAEHGEDAGEMAEGIQKNTSDLGNLIKLVGTLPAGATSTTVVAYIAEAIAALNIGDYAKTSEMNVAISNSLANYYTKVGVDTLLSDYVKKSGDKVLSDNNYTTADKNKLAGIATGATKVTGSSLNGQININGVETTVYVEPDDVLHGAWATDAEVNAMLTNVFGE